MVSIIKPTNRIVNRISRFKLLHFNILVCILLSCITAIDVNAQREIFYDLDKYKQVNFQRKSLILIPDGIVNFADQINIVGAEAELDIYFNGEIERTNVRNEKNKQYSSYQSLDLGVGPDRFIGLNLSSTKRMYKGNYYILSGYRLTGTNNFRESANSIQKRKDLRNSIDWTIGFGSGRIEYVNHAWSAILILQALEDNQLLQRMPSENEITNFANLIGAIRTKRIIDSRLRDIDILEVIIDHLKESKFIEESATLPTLIVQDNYAYDETINRFTGQRFELSLTPKINTRFIKEPSEDWSHNNTYSLRGDIEYRSYTNHDVHWRNYFSYGSSLTYEQFHTTSSNVNRSSLTGRLFASLSYLYIPNLRNNFEFYFNPSISMRALFVEDNTNIESAFFISTARLSYNHYFSPQTQFSSAFYLRYDDEEFQAGQFQPSINSQLTFSIIHNLY